MILENKEVPIVNSAAEIAPLDVSTDSSGVESDRLALEQYSESGNKFKPNEQEVLTSAPKATPLPTLEEVKKLEKDQVHIEVEKILEEGMADQWKAMPDALKPTFKQKGEQVAHAIVGIITQNSGTGSKKGFEVSGIMELVNEWLRMIPKVNRFFLEQEAKIKTDRLIKYLAVLQQPNQEQKS